MAKYDPDRIAALASGALDPAEAAVLEAEIAADPRAAAELATQRLALEAVHRAPAPLLSDAERTELRRAVAAALHLEDSAQPAAAALASRRRVPWRPLAVAAAALTALVAAVPLFGLLSVGDNEAAPTTIALSATTESQDFATAGAEDPDTLGEEGGPGDAAILGTAATTTAAATTLPPQNLTREMIYAGETVESLLADPARLFAIEADGAVACLDEARILLQAADPAGLRLDPAEGGRAMVIWFLSSDGATVEDLVALDAETCELLAVYP
jgi:hypothetical protein